MSGDAFGALAARGMDVALQALMDKLPDWAGLFQGSKRWLRLEAANPAVFADLMVLRFTAREAISECGLCEIELLGADAGKALKAFVAEPVSLCLDTDDGKAAPRRIAGIVEHAASLGSDGGVTRYQIRVRPALHFLSYAEHNRVFQDRSIQQIVDTLLTEHQAALPTLRWRWQLSRALPALPYRVQFRETDLAFVERLLAGAGIFYCVQAGAAAGEHELVFSDDTRSFSGADSFRFHRAAMSEHEDTITEWQATRSLVAGGHTSVATRREGGGAFEASEYNPLRQGSRGDALSAALWRHRVRSPGAGPLLDEVVIQNRHDAAHAEADNKLFHGRSTLRQLATGQVFTLRDHPHHDGEPAASRVFVTLRVEHEGRNEIADRLDWRDAQRPQQDQQSPLYQNCFTVIRHAMRWLPDLPANAPLPGLQRATVVGSAGEVVHTDGLGQVKVCFPWQRAADHRIADTGSAVEGEFSSCWLPVAQSAAGPGRGALWLPRVGDEVLVGFVDDDIDQPIVMGSVFHPGHQPASFKAVSALPADKTLSGLRSVEHHGARASELIFDDTTNEPHVTLRSDHGDSHLQLGVLTSERSGGNASLRGEGFDLFTGRWASLRSGWGLFLSAQSGASSGDHHYKRQTLSAQLDTLQTVVNAHKEGAKQLRTSAVPDNDFTTLKGHAGAWQQGDKPANTQPIIVAHGDAGAVISSSENTLVSARTQVDLGSTQAIGIQAGTTWTGSASEQIAFWSWKAGIALNAGGKDLILRANSKQIIGEAEKGIRLSGIDGNVHLESGKEIVLTAQGSYIRIGKNIEIGTQGKIQYKGAQHQIQAGSSLTANLPGLSNGSGDTDQKFYVRLPDGFPFNDMLHNVRVNGAIRQARVPTGKSGETSKEPDAGFSTMRVELLELPRARTSDQARITWENATRDIPENVEEVPIRFTPDGMPYAEATMTPKKHETCMAVIAPPPTAIPVIFVPGIMGSNIASKSSGKSAWNPPNGTKQALTELATRIAQSPADRQSALNPDSTVVSNSGAIALSDAMKNILDEAEARARGWGEVHADSYGDILQFLEEHLNRRVNNPFSKTKPKPVWLQALKSKVAAIVDTDVKALADYYFPVYACGYNWLESNGKSAERLAQRVDEALARFNNGYFKNIGKVIIITHSMGGMVARAYAQKSEGKVLAVVHGVQPVGGAPAVYRRMRAGTEVGANTLMGYVASAGGAAVLGWNAADVTAVMANANGPLELLPTKHYYNGKPWLKIVEVKSGWGQQTRRELHSLPANGNPYQEIYKVAVEDKWWGMIDEALIDPAKIHPAGAEQSSSDTYMQRVDAIEQFHDSLGLYMHPVTYAHYGDDHRSPTFPEVLWETKDEIPEQADIAAIINEPRAQARWQDKAFDVVKFFGVLPGLDSYEQQQNKGRTDVNVTCTTDADKAETEEVRLSFQLADKSGDNAGDGTVPTPSGELVAQPGVKRVWRLTASDLPDEALDHQHSHKPSEVRETILWSVVEALKQV